MERLTKYEPCEGGIPLVTVEDEQSALQRLAAYEDAEERGLLVRLSEDERKEFEKWKTERAKH